MVLGNFKKKPGLPAGLVLVERPDRHQLTIRQVIGDHLVPANLAGGISLSRIGYLRLSLSSYAWQISRRSLAFFKKNTPEFPQGLRPADI